LRFSKFFSHRVSAACTRMAVLPRHDSASFKFRTMIIIACVLCLFARPNTLNPHERAWKVA
jgi:hypothetical protein